MIFACRRYVWRRREGGGRHPAGLHSDPPPPRGSIVQHPSLHRILNGRLRKRQLADRDGKRGVGGAKYDGEKAWPSINPPILPPESIEFKTEKERQLSDRDGRVGEGAEEEQNHSTARKPGPL
jgi:hypothetical protein